ncbi:MAG: sulfatase-like hydrolase/transferase [Acidobacteria bacterium]|jgi:arylsulfatase A-like enzyme/Tfp pilus assembly protein PilF|nr:sulfatase-like hydrolase/transferase [Acidobacteriota bacterium]
MIKKKLLPAFVILCLCFPLKSAFAIKKNPGANVLIITLDTTRADHIGTYGYKPAQTPNIDSIARSGVQFQNAYTPVPLTLPAHCSIFTGNIPLAHGVRNNGRYRLDEKTDTMTEILQRRGYMTAAFVSSFTLDSRFGLDQGFNIYNDNLTVKKGQVKTYDSERTADLVYSDFVAWFESYCQGDKNKKFFAWIHFFDPHMPYNPPGSFRNNFQNPYDGEIAYMDLYIGKIINLLKAKQVLDNTLLILAGDHGEGFGEHGEFGHMMFCYEENLKVPLIFYSPGYLPGNINITTTVSLIDIMPSILNFLDIKTPGILTTQGISLLPLVNGAAIKDRPFYIESIFPEETLACAPVKGLIKGDYKIIDLPKPELYNLAKDPLEKENIFFKENINARQLKQTLDALVKRYEQKTVQSGHRLTPEEERKLNSLGYFTSANKKINNSNPVKLPDPKDKIAGLTEFFTGSRLKGEGKTREAIPYFKRAIEMNPTLSWPYSLLALSYLESDMIAEAIQTIKKGIALNPGEYQLKIDYSLLLKKQARIIEAIQILKDLLLQKEAIFDAGAEVYCLLGELYVEKSDTGNAIANFRRALAAEPENNVIKQKLVYLLHQNQKYSEALELYRELEKETPGDAGLLLNIALLYEQINKYDLSKSYYIKLLKGKKAPPIQVYYNYALLLGKTGDFKDAIIQMQQFLDNYSPEDSLKKTALDYLGTWKKKFPL